MPATLADIYKIYGDDYQNINSNLDKKWRI